MLSKSNDKIRYVHITSDISIKIASKIINESDE
jgi:hypothetical protein